MEQENKSSKSNSLGAITETMDTLPMKISHKVNITTDKSIVDANDSETHKSVAMSEDLNDTTVCPRHDKLGCVHVTIGESSEPSDSTSTKNELYKKIQSFLREEEEKRIARSIALNEMKKEVNENYKSACEIILNDQDQMRKELEKVQNELKTTTKNLEDCKEKLRIAKNTCFEETMLRKSSEADLHRKCEHTLNLKKTIYYKDMTIKLLQDRVTEIENVNEDMYDYRRKIKDLQQKVAEDQNEIRRLSEGLTSRDQIIRRLEEVIRRRNDSGSSSPSGRDQEIAHLQEHLKMKDDTIQVMMDDCKRLQRSLVMIHDKMKETGNIVELRIMLKEERRKNAELSEMIVKLETELEMKNLE